MKMIKKAKCAECGAVSDERRYGKVDPETHFQCNDCLIAVKKAKEQIEEKNYWININVERLKDAKIAAKLLILQENYEKEVLELLEQQSPKFKSLLPVLR